VTSPPSDWSGKRASPRRCDPSAPSSIPAPVFGPIARPWPKLIRPAYPICKEADLLESSDPKLINSISCSGLILQDLTFVHVGNQDYLSKGVINFSKRWQQYNIIDNMKRFKKW